MNRADKLIILDTTLRDGEQTPGVALSAAHKLEFAIQLDSLGVDVIEAGFAAASESDYSAIKLISKNIKNASTCSLARAIHSDIERAAEAIKPSPSPRIHTFIATSNIHMQYKLKLSPNDVIQQAVQAIKHAKRYCDDVQFYCEDASRSEFQFLCRIMEHAIRAGATTINIADTVGFALPQEFGMLTRNVLNTILNADKATFSVHCHNDLGLATANSLSAIQAGARQIECTVNGLGERAGNTALEEVVMALQTHPRQFNLSTNINPKLFVSCSQKLASLSGIQPQPNKAIVGENAFRHESGIHQDGILKHPHTYEIMRPQDVGWQQHQLPLGRLSGRSALLNKMDELNITLKSESDFNDLFIRFKQLADQQQTICDTTLIQLSKKGSGLI